MFIVIDGIDGSGKGTQLKLVRDRLTKIGKRVKVLDYPRYGEKSAFMVEKYLNGDYGKDVNPKLASIFYAIDRYDDFKSSFKEEVGDCQDYDYIISNRYVSASMIHQAGKIKDKDERLKFMDWLTDLEYNIFGIPKPDKTIFLNVSPEVSSELVLKKEKREYIKGDKKKDLHEADKDHMNNACLVANEIVDIFEDWVKIDCEDKENGEMMKMDIITDKIMGEILLK